MGCGLANDSLRIAQRVRRALWGIVAVIRGAAAWCLGRMGLDQHAIGVNAHERAIAAHPDAAADERARDGVERLAEADVMIGMHRAMRPARRIEALARQWREGR